MDFTWSDEQEMVRKMVRDFAEKEIKAQIPVMEEDVFPRKVVDRMAELGLMGIPVPEEYGGSGMDFSTYILALHELSKVSATVGVILSVHTSVGTNPILYFGNEEQKKHYLPKLASGEYLGAFALTEAAAGSDASSLKTSAKQEGDDYIMQGSKVFITNGGEADTYIVFARTSQEGGYKGVSAFIVEKDAPGLVIGKKEKKMGLHGSSTVELIFDQCRISKKQLLGKEGAGLEIAMANLNVGRIGIAAQALGIAEAALDHAVAYAKERTQFGKPIAENQGISFKLADMATAVEAAKLLVYQAAWMRQNGKECIKEASMAKMFASKAAVDNAIEAVQIFGGYGYTKDYPAERLFRDAKICQIYEGTSEIQHIVISKQLLK